MTHTTEAPSREAQIKLAEKVDRTLRDGAAERGLDPHSLCYYVQNGSDPGHFLGAVLEGDLFRAACRADKENYAKLADWAMLVFSCVPATARGSRGAVDTWMACGGLQGLILPAGEG